MQVTARDLGTHYYVEDADACRYVAFEMGECETCGAEVQEANAMYVHGGEEKLIRLGLKKVDFLPSEIWYDDESGMCKCENCD